MRSRVVSKPSAEYAAATPPLRGQRIHPPYRVIQTVARNANGVFKSLCLSISLPPKFAVLVKRGKLSVKLKAGINTMASITFDTLKFVERLKSAGVSEEQAKAEVEALTEALN